MKRKILNNNMSLPKITVRQNEKGSILVFALIVLSFILLAAFSLASISLIERRSADMSVNSATAFQNSDKGMEEFLQQLYKELDPTDDLDDFAGALGSGYDCHSGSADPVRIGNEDTEFIITPYEEVPFDELIHDTEWDAVNAMTECDRKLADVARFRATGNYHNAARAVFLKLRDSLTRGLVAHWSFEDRAQNSNLDLGETAIMAMDSSKNNYTLTLCHPEEDNVVVTDQEDNSYHAVDFDECQFNASDFMSPEYEDDDNPDGAWREGIVDEATGQTGGGVFGSAAAEALYFDGTNDYLTALTNVSDCHVLGCDATVNYVESDNADRLNLEDGIAISAWINRDSVDPNQTIVAKQNNDNGDIGYRLWVNDSDVCFQIGSDGDDEELCSNAGSSIDDDTWAHIVAIWRQDDDEGGEMKIYVNADKLLDITTFNGDIDTNDAPLSIGATFDGNWDAEYFFNGKIDDVRIWKRALTENEICRLCKDADKTGDNTDCNTQC